MAEVRKIVIEIGEMQNNQPSSSSTSQGGGPYSYNTKKNLTSSIKPELYYKNKEAEQQIISLKTMAIQNTLQAIKQSVNLSTRRYFSLSEDYIGENNFNNVSTAISKVTGLASQIMVGAQIGGPIGALAGVVTWGVTESINYKARMSSYYSSLNATNYNTSYERTRAGLVDNGRGTEN